MDAVGNNNLEEQLTTLQTWHQRPSRGPPEASHLVEASCLFAIVWHGGGLQGDLWRLASFEPTLCSSDPLLHLLVFCVTDSGLQQQT